MRLRNKDWGLLFSICGLLLAVTGYIHDSSPIVWIGCVITIIGFIVPGKDTLI